MPDPHPSLFDTAQGSARWAHLLPDWMRTRLIAEARPVIDYDRGPGRRLRVSVVHAPDRSCWFASYSYDLAPFTVALLCERCSFWGVERHQALLDLRDRFAALASAEPT